MAKVNLTHPGKPNYTGPTKGLFTCIHHQELIEWSDDIMDRVGYIKEHKPKHEHKVRLASLVHVPVTYHTMSPSIVYLVNVALNTQEVYSRYTIGAVLHQLLCDVYRKEALAIVRKLIPKGNWVERKNGDSGLRFPAPPKDFNYY